MYTTKINKIVYLDLKFECQILKHKLKDKSMTLVAQNLKNLNLHLNNY
jgi:hypothetical protein